MFDRPYSRTLKAGRSCSVVGLVGYVELAGTMSKIICKFDCQCSRKTVSMRNTYVETLLDFVEMVPV